MSNGVVIIRFWHPVKDLSFLEDLLGMDCSRSWVAGSPRETPNGRLLIGKNKKSYWSSSVEYNPETGFKGIFLSIINRLLNVNDELCNFNESGGKIEIYLQLPGSINNGDTIESEHMKMLGEIGVDILIEVFPKA